MLQSNYKPEHCRHGCFQPLQVPVLLKARHACRRGFIGRRYVLDAHILAGAPRRAHLPLAQPQVGQKANLRAGTSHSAAAAVAAERQPVRATLVVKRLPVEGAAAGAESSSRRLRTKLAAKRLIAAKRSRSRSCSRSGLAGRWLSLFPRMDDVQLIHESIARQ